MGDQVNIAIAREIVYKSNEIGALCLALTFIEPQMSECTSCKGINAYVTFSKGFPCHSFKRFPSRFSRQIIFTSRSVYFSNLAK